MNLLFALLACGESEVRPVAGTTIRIAEPKSSVDNNRELQLAIFSDEDDCNNVVGAQDVPLCMPYVDRASGQVRFAFQAKVDGENWRIPHIPENFAIYHKSRAVEQAGQYRWEVIPHDPQPGEQLFILLIDASGSMGEMDDGSGKTRMEKVKDALLRKDVVESFFPPGIATAVVPLVFRGGLPTPLGDKLIVDNAKEYRTLIREKLQVGGGYTYLYKSIDWATDTLLETPEIQNSIMNRKQTPTIIALTDGFNNEDGKDLCSTNVGRLQSLINQLQLARREGDFRYRPTVWTVGLGRKAWDRFVVPEQPNVTEQALCKRKGAERIDGGIERQGVDNAALAWIASVGGGKTYVSRKSDGLAEAFKQAAAVRWKWFEVRYQVDPFYLRRKFEAKIQLVSMTSTEASIWIHPSAWLDAPPGIRDAKGWAQPQPYTRTATLIFPLLGALAALGYLPAARHNVMRALFSRVASRRGRT